MRLLRQLWFQIIVAGILLFFGVERALVITNNIHYVPTVLLTGAFLVPAAFVAYFSGRESRLDRQAHSSMSWGIVLFCFIGGGITGTVIAGLLEFATLQSSSILTLFGVGLWEEGAKLIFPIIIYLFARQYKTENDGLLIGVSAGMGFAALETMGYGLAAIISTNGNVTDLVQLLFFRGLLSPLGHAAWTGIVCAVIWRERARGRVLFTPAVLWAFILAVVLHAFWNIASSFSSLAVVIIGYIIVGGISLGLLIFRIREAENNKVTNPPDIYLDKKEH